MLKRQLQHARPCPQLADSQRRDALIAGQELDELVAIEAAVALVDELDGNLLHARVAGVLARRERRERVRKPARKIPADIGDLGRHQVEVVEQPVRRRFDESSVADVVGQRPVRAAQHAHVLGKSRKRVARAAARIGIDRESRGERQRALLEALDAEQFVTKRLLRNG